mgnify:CR=1 FL=1
MGLNIGNLLLAGGVGYVVFKTFLLEERVNDLTVLLKRQTLNNNNTRDVKPDVMRPTTPRPQEEDYETSDDEMDEEDDDEEQEEDARRRNEEEDVRRRNQEEDARRRNEEEDARRRNEEEVRIEELPYEVTPSRAPQKQVTIAESNASAFVTTRQRRSGSELRRDSSRPLSTREP